MEFNKAKEMFTAHLVMKGRDPLTLEAYERVFVRLGAFLADKGLIDMAATMKEHIREFAEQERARLNPKGLPLSGVTSNQNLSFLKVFLEWLRDENYIYSNLAKEITFAKLPQKLPRSILTTGEVRKILRSVDTSTALGYRDRTMLEVLYSTGIRRQEIMNLTVNDVDAKDGYLRINLGKGKKDRVVPLGKIACQYVENYIQHVRPLLLKNDPLNNHLFLSLIGNKMCRGVVAHMISKYVKESGVKKHVSPHTFRHTCATVLLKNKANIRYVQELLGHESIETTTIYTHLTITDLKEVHKRCHPRERESQ